MSDSFFNFFLLIIVTTMAVGCASSAPPAKDQDNFDSVGVYSADTLESSSPTSSLIASGDSVTSTDAGADTEEQTFDAEEYRIGPQDLMDIQVFGVADLSTTVRVNTRGLISMPLIGQVGASGLTVDELEKLIAAKLADEYLQDPDVSVFVKEYASQRVTIEGAVNRPGIYALNGQTSLMQAIAMAQGLGELADPQDIKLFRTDTGQGRRKMASFDLDQIRSGESDDPLLKGNDLIVVQKSGARSFLRDSVFRDVTDLLNPFRLLAP